MILTPWRTIQEGNVSFRFTSITALCVGLASVSCMQTTDPTHPWASTSRQSSAIPSATRSEAPVDRPEEVQVSGAFRHGDFVISVHGLRLEPDYEVQAVYDLDPESPWPLSWPGGMDFLTSHDGRLWEYLQDGTFFPVNTGAVARLKETGNGFTYSVPLSAMHDPSGPITFSIVIANFYPSTFFFRAFGRSECQHCPKVAARQ
jgi:hypothetical protein